MGKRKASKTCSRGDMSVCHELKRKPEVLYQRWEKASRSRLAGAGFKPPDAAALKRRGSERSSETEACFCNDSTRFHCSSVKYSLGYIALSPDQFLLDLDKPIFDLSPASLGEKC
jgi:hypothetical protein